jgi:UDP-glucose 4-epimerase
MIAMLMDTSLEVRHEGERMRPPASEVMRLVSDSGQLRQLTDWRPAYTLEEGLRQTIAWFRDPTNLARYKVGQFTL